MQDAFVKATERWPNEGMPPNPAGWIVTTARNRAIDQLRRNARGRELAAELMPAELSTAHSDPIGGDGAMSDDRLRLIFTCCHPALRTESQVALTLRLLGGLTIGEVARSFLITESAAAKRLVRAKYKIKAARIPYRVPSASELPSRLHAVLTVIYLIYNAGYNDVARTSLRREAMRLGRLLVELMPDEREAAGLVALMLLSEARSASRFSDGEIVLLRDQDRSRWNRDQIREGQQIVRECLRSRHLGSFQVQAAIQAVHCSATSFDETNWGQILAWYDRLLEIEPTEVVALNRAIVIGELRGPEAELRELNSLTELDGYYLLHAARADALRRVGDRNAAVAAYQRAEALAATDSDRRFLARQVAALSS